MTINTPKTPQIHHSPASTPQSGQVVSHTKNATHTLLSVKPNNIHLAMDHKGVYVTNVVKYKEKGEITQSDIKEYFYSEPLELWTILPTGQRTRISIQWNKLRAVATIMGIHDGISSNDDWYRLLGKIFHTTVNSPKSPTLTKEMIRKGLGEDIEKLLRLSEPERMQLDVWWYKISAMAKELGVIGNAHSNNSVWRHFLSEVYDRDLMLPGEQKITTQSLKAEFARYGKEYLKALPAEERKKLKIHGHALSAIARFFGISYMYYYDVHWNQLIDTIFDLKDEQSN